MERVLFVDLLRFVAAFQMLQGHTIAALLAPAYRVGKWHALWSAARGLTSVAFLFAAGLSFYITTARGHAARPRVIRGLGLIALGYVLHLPLTAASSDDPAQVQEAWRGFAAVDVLQCIGVCLLVLQALATVLRSLSALAFASAVCALVLLALTPLSARLSLDTSPRWLLGYVSPATGSLFPLLPWAAHVFAGVAVAALITPRREQPSWWRVGTAGRLAALGGAVLVCAWQLSAWPLYAGVGDQLTRLGRVLLLCAGLAAGLARARALPGWVASLGAETLLLYVFHVLLVYGAGVGLAFTVGPRLTPLPAVLAALAVVVLSFAVALGYRRWRSAKLLAAARGTR